MFADSIRLLLLKSRINRSADDNDQISRCRSVTGRGAGTILYVWGDQSIKINVVVKSGEDQYIGGPPRF